MEQIHRPWHREEHVEQKRGIQSAPLCQVRRATIVVRNPKRQFSTQKALAQIKRLWIAKRTKITVNKSIQAEQNFGERNEERAGQKNQEATTRQPLLGVWTACRARAAGF